MGDVEWCFDDNVLKYHALNLFSRLYTTDNYSFDNVPFKGRFPVILDYLIAGISTEVTLKDVHHVVFSMVPLKAHDIDGFHAKFYQASWDILGDSVLRLVKWVFQVGLLNLRFNKTLLILILKVPHAKSINQFRPTSLCNVLYKIITKMIVIQLRQVMQILITKPIKIYSVSKHF